MYSTNLQTLQTWTYKTIADSWEWFRYTLFLNTVLYICKQYKTSYKWLYLYFDVFVSNIITMGRWLLWCRLCRPWRHRRSSSCAATSIIACHQKPRILAFGVPSEWLGTKVKKLRHLASVEKLKCFFQFFSSTGVCTAAKFQIAHRLSQINAQLYSASIT